MTETRLSDKVRAFLERSFPEGSIDHGYYFVSFRSEAWRLIKTGHIQQVADKLCEGRCWLIAVNIDPRSDVNGMAVEERPVTYSPDWNIQEEYTQFIVEFQGQIDINALFRRGKVPGALAIIDPARGIALNVNMRRIYAESRAALESFIVGIENHLEPPEPEYKVS